MTTGGGRGRGEPWDQRLARALVRPLVATPVTPNHVTALSLLVGLTAGACYAAGGAAAHWGGALLMASLLIDHADGELARMSGKTSVFGHYFDYVSDGVVLVAAFTGMGVGLPEGALGGWAVLAGIAAGTAIAATFLLRDAMSRRHGQEAIAQPTIGGFEVQDVMYLVGPITWLGGLAPFLALAGVGAPLFLLWQLWDFRRVAREGAAP